MSKRYEDVGYDSILIGKRLNQAYVIENLPSIFELRYRLGNVRPHVVLSELAI